MPSSQRIRKAGFVSVCCVLCVWLAGCQSGMFDHPPPCAFRETAHDRVIIVTGAPDNAFFRRLPDARHFLIMIPGISSGDLEQQGRFLSELRQRSGADVAIFLDWGQHDPTRKMASAQATSRAADELAALCRLLHDRTRDGATVDLLAHSAGTIVANKASQRLGKTSVRWRHVVFLGTPHDPEADIAALLRISRAVVNIHSCYDKINRNVSGDGGRLQALTGEPYWNQQLDTSLGGRQIRHDSFLENTPENWCQYAHVLKHGTWPKPLGEWGDAGSTPEDLYRIAAWVRANKTDARKHPRTAELIDNSLRDANPEIQTYGALLAGLLANPSFRKPLKRLLENDESHVYLRREIYRALGTIGDPDDLRYLQQRRKSDPESGDALRDVLREWKWNRIRTTNDPERPVSQGIPDSMRPRY